MNAGAVDLEPSLDHLGEALALVGACMAIEMMRPRKRVDCASAQRPCPFVGCRSNMIIDVTEDGEIIFNSGLVDAERGEGANRVLGPDVPDVEFYRQADNVIDWWRKMFSRATRLHIRPPDSCLEDIIDRHQRRMMSLADDDPSFLEGMHLEKIGLHMFITRERARQLEGAALDQLKASAPRIKSLLEDATAGRWLRRLLAGAGIRSPW